MKIQTPEISWHERDPIYTCQFHPIRKYTFVTAGVTGVIRLWEIKPTEADTIEVEFLASLKRHTKAVNTLRWNHDGTMLASAGDEAVVLLWNENDIKNQKTLDNDEDESKENWFAFKTLRGHLEDILDLCWSKDGTILISGSIDNSAIVWNIATGNKIAILKEPKGFVQGVTYDPLGSYYLVMSTDRSLRYYSTSSNKCIFNVNRMTMAATPKQENTETDATPNTQNMRLFHDDTMKSFYRRLCFSPDGNFIFTPAGCLEFEDRIINVSYIFTRGCLNKPCLYIQHDKPSNAIAVCPLKFELLKHEEPTETAEEGTEKNTPVFNLPYRLVFAIATEDSILIYDTQHLVPFGYVTGIHYSNITDISWSNNGRLLTVSSIDGFVTFVFFAENELGEVCTAEFETVIESTSSQSSSQPKQTPSSTPTQSSKTTKQTTEVPVAEKKVAAIKTLFANQKAKSKQVILTAVTTTEDEVMDVTTTTTTTTKPQKEDIDAITIVPENTTTTTKAAPRRVKLVPLN